MGRTFHDLRRSAVLYLRRLGLAETDIMEACGWKTRSAFARYCIEDESGLAERMRRAVERNFGTTSAQNAPRAASTSFD